jgi:hypothetical protein
VSLLNKRIIFSVSAFLFMFFSGCGSTDDKDKTDIYILKSQDIIISSAHFTEELELRKASYTYNIKDNPSEYNNIVLQIVKDLSEEIVLLHTAREKSITITDQEFMKAEELFLKDYPNDTFKMMLLTNAVEYSFWQKRYRNKLIIDKLIQKELREKIVIKTEDVVKFYDKHKKEGKQDLSENELILQLREQKTEEKYFNWINQAIDKYPVEINKEELKKFFIGLRKTKKE